ncbi:glycosyltransferase [Paenibacillus sedimenti]|uniref:Glycosyltransferase n=1 Tax=Paenibacillus sedimenti TaxID=2770274 RepID=A0A926QHX4_9BACL|nr:glycosyltransferase [Paenibacillus sedimenti]MBD0379945.1 glycosyltransferase [Paenibacillus sedimenti]
MKIIYFTTDRTMSYQRAAEFFKQKLAKLPDIRVQYVNEGGPISKILAKANFAPDFIYIDNLERFILNHGPITGLSKINIPKGLSFMDLHRNKELLLSFVKKNKIDLVFAHYRNAFLRDYPQLADRFRWLPHHVYTPVFKDYGYKKTIDYLLMGAINKNVYPLRFKIYKQMKYVKGFVYHSHPGYRNFTKQEEQKIFIADGFAKEINRAKIFFTDHLIYNYPIAKYFEVLACNTLLLANGSKELRDLGFIDGVTYVEINKDNFIRKAQYYLKHEEERKEIARRGYQMVRSQHSTEIRAQQFADELKRYLK